MMIMMMENLIVLALLSKYFTSEGFLSIGSVEAFHASIPRHIPKLSSSYTRHRYLPVLYASQDVLDVGVDDFRQVQLQNIPLHDCEGRPYPVEMKGILDEIKEYQSDFDPTKKDRKDLTSAISIVGRFGDAIKLVGPVLVAAEVAGVVGVLLPLMCGLAVWAIKEYVTKSSTEEKEVKDRLDDAETAIMFIAERVNTAKSFQDLDIKVMQDIGKDLLVDTGIDELSSLKKLIKRDKNECETNCGRNKKFDKEEGINIGKALVYYVILAFTRIWALSQMAQIDNERGKVYYDKISDILANDKKMMKDIVGVPSLVRHENSIYGGIHRLPLEQLALIESYANIAGVGTGRLVSIQSNSKMYWRDCSWGVAAKESKIDLRMRFRYFEEPIVPGYEGPVGTGYLFCCYKGVYVQPDSNSPGEKLWPRISYNAKKHLGGWTIPKTNMSGNTEVSGRITYRKNDSVQDMYGLTYRQNVPIQNNIPMYAYMSKKPLRKGYIRLTKDEVQAPIFTVRDIK